MKHTYICEECMREISRQEYEQQSDIFCPECGGRIGKVNQDDTQQQAVKKKATKQPPGKLWGCFLIVLFTASAISSFRSVPALYSYSFIANQTFICMGLILSLAAFTATGLSLIRWFLIRANKMKLNWLFRLMQMAAVLVVPVMITGQIIERTMQHSLELTDKIYLPVITSIENHLTDSGQPPVDILSVLSKIDIDSIQGYFPRQILYYRDNDSYSLSIAAGSLDMDGSTNYWNAQKNRWVHVHNDILQHPENSEDAKVFIQSYQSLPQTLYIYQQGQWLKHKQRYP